MTTTDRGAGPAVVLLHAFPCDSSQWSDQNEALVAAGFRVIAPDLPGFGGTDLPDAEPSLDSVVAQVLGVLDRAEVDRCILGGSSLGGYVAMGILRARPELVGALALCGTKATADGADAAAAREVLSTAVDAEPDRAAEILTARLFDGLVGASARRSAPDVVQRVRRWIDTVPPRTASWYQRAMAARPDSLADLAALAAPALVVWGTEDTVSPRSEQDLMLGVLSQGELLVIDDAGHLAGVEQPSAVSAGLVRFARSVTDLRSS